MNWKRITIRLSVLLAFVFLIDLETVVVALPVETEPELQQEWIQEKLGSSLKESDQIASGIVADQFSKQISSIEWLAPLAPVALSPFFGITLLAGLACFGPEWLPDNALLSEGSPLANPTMFWIFLVLTVITSAPRFSKVSKPIAQFADFLETYSVIVILLVLKASSMQSFYGGEAEAIIPVQAGILSFGWEGLLMLAMAINVVVVNTVKFFFEFLVWITPIPFLDACFEIANKTICAALMAVYAFSPVAALIINIVMFAVCLFAFVWIKRREVFYRSMLADWIVRWWNQATSNKSAVTIPSQMKVFPKVAVGSIPARAKCSLERIDSGWTLTHQRMLRASLVEELVGSAELDQGWWTNAIVFDDKTRLTFSSKFNDCLPELASAMRFGLGDVVAHSKLPTDRQVDFS